MCSQSYSVSLLASELLGCRSSPLLSISQLCWFSFYSLNLLSPFLFQVICMSCFLCLKVFPQHFMWLAPSHPLDPNLQVILLKYSSFDHYHLEQTKWYLLPTPSPYLSYSTLCYLFPLQYSSKSVIVQLTCLLIIIYFLIIF